MSDHTCKELTDGCYRCDLNRDEIRGYIESLRVTRSGVVHDPDCHHLDKSSSSALRWTPHPSDRACLHCLDGELPTA